MADCVFHDDIKERVDEHETRITNLEINEAGHGANMEALCKRLDDLITMIKWAIGTTIGGLACFAAFLEVFYR